MNDLGKNKRTEANHGRGREERRQTLREISHVKNLVAYSTRVLIKIGEIRPVNFVDVSKPLGTHFRQFEQTPTIMISRGYIHLATRGRLGSRGCSLEIFQPCQDFSEYTVEI